MPNVFDQFDAAPAAPAPVAANPFDRFDDGGTLPAVAKFSGNLAAGAVRGAGSIGATLLWPFDAARDALSGNTGSSHQDRLHDLDQGLQAMGADPNSLAYRGGKVAAEVAGTAGAGGLIAKGIRAAPIVANAIPNLTRAIETSGLLGGNLATRATGGAISGAAQTALVDPSQTVQGAEIGGALPVVGGVAGTLGSKLASAMRPAVDPQKLQAARAASAAGYVIPPSDVRPQGIFTGLLGGLSGKAKTAQVASERNQAVTDALAKSELGIPEATPLTRDTLADIRKQAGAAYQNVRGIGTIQSDPQYLAAIDRVGADMRGAARSFPGLTDDKIGSILDTLKQPQFDAGDAVDAIGVLRDKADAAFRSGDKGIARAYRAASGALEDAIGRKVQSIGNPDLLNAFQNARQTIAKTYSVEKALNSQTGEVSAQALAGQLKKGKPLSGGLLTIAQTGEAFPKATQALKEAPKALSPLDFMAGLMSEHAGNGLLGVATLGARPAARAAILSGPMQRYAMRDLQMPLFYRASSAAAPVAYRLAPQLGLLDSGQ